MQDNYYLVTVMNPTLHVVGWVSLDYLRIRGRTYFSPGGSALYASLASTILPEVSVVLRTKIGCDFPDEVIEFIRKLGIQLADGSKMQEKSTRFVVFYDKDWNCSYESLGENAGISLEPIPSESLSQNPDLALITAFSPHLQLKWAEVFTTAKTPFCLGTNQVHTEKVMNHETILRSMKLAKIFVCNRQEAIDLTRRKCLSQALSVLTDITEIPIITMGSEGVIYSHQGCEYSVPAIPTLLVDPSGAGDTFSGTLACMYAKGIDIHEAIRASIAASSRTIQSVGVGAYIPTFVMEVP